ncbi:hypothetical protein LguiA_006136 [Lonicera macranthoides]
MSCRSWSDTWPSPCLPNPPIIVLYDTISLLSMLENTEYAMLMHPHLEYMWIKAFQTGMTELNPLFLIYAWICFPDFKSHSGKTVDIVV